MDSEQEPLGSVTGAARTPLALRPLTQCHPNGKPYTRRAKTARQIRAALGLSPKEQIARAQLRAPEAEAFLSDEALVYLIRHHWERGDGWTGDWLFRWLVERCTGIVVKELTRRLPQQDAVDAGQDLLTTLHAAVCDLGSRGDFLEIAFGQWLKRRALDVRRHWEAKRREAQRQVPVEATDGPGTEPVVPWDVLAPSPADLLDREEDDRRLRALVDDLPEPLRTVTILHFYAGMKISAVDPDEPTLMRHFGKSATTITTWLNKAKAALRQRLENEQ